MAGGVMSAQDGGTEFPGRLTVQVILCSLIAAFGGLMFGYDIGISGPYYFTHSKLYMYYQFIAELPGFIMTLGPRIV